MATELFTSRQREILFAALEAMHAEAIRTEDDTEERPAYSSEEIGATIRRLEAIP